MTYGTLAADEPLIAALPATLALVASLLSIVTIRSGYTIQRDTLHHTSWRGRRSYPRAAFLGVERTDAGRGKPGLLLRFQTGALMLSDDRGCSHPLAVQNYLEEHWHASSAEQPRDPIGPVMENLTMEYESVHLILLGFATLALAALSAMGPMFWVSAVFALFTGRMFYRIYRCRRIFTDHEGLAISRPLQPQLKMRWDKITSVRYWYSLAHGGIILSDGTNTIRVYRRIQNYPRLNRLVQDNVAPASFPAPAALPWSISLNRRRQGSWLVLAITTGFSLWLLTWGAWPAALILMAVPSVTFLFTVIASSRKIEITRDKVRLTEKKAFVETTYDYLRADLDDIRLARQLSAGGLWMKFGNERLEIGNLDSECAPEEILAVLRRAWQTETAAVYDEFRAA